MESTRVRLAVRRVRADPKARKTVVEKILSTKVHSKFLRRSTTPAWTILRINSQILVAAIRPPTKKRMKIFQITSCIILKTSQAPALVSEGVRDTRTVSTRRKRVLRSTQLETRIGWKGVLQPGRNGPRKMKNLLILGKLITRGSPPRINIPIINLSSSTLFLKIRNYCPRIRSTLRRITPIWINSMEDSPPQKIHILKKTAKNTSRSLSSIPRDHPKGS